MIGSALELFSAHGYSGTGFRDVISHSGAPRGSIYHHFPRGKTELAEEVIRRNSANFVAHIENLRPTDPIAVLHAYVEWSRRLLEASGCRAGCAVAAVVLEAHDGPELFEMASAGWSAMADGLAAMLRASGVPRQRASGLGTLTVASLQGALVVCRAARDIGPLDAVERELDHTLRAAIDDARS